MLQGDVGGPLSCMVDGRFDLAGIASFFNENCDTRYPSVFTSIAPYLHWIVDNTGVQPRPSY